jgi:hypothetical protein
VKRSTAIRHLVEMAGVASKWHAVPHRPDQWPLDEMWVSGELLGFADPIEVGSVVLVLDVPEAELPWLARHPAGEFVGEQLRLGKRPMRWCYRPRGAVVWNHEHRRLARVWTGEGGLDEQVIQALESRRFEGFAVVEPTAAQLEGQVRSDLTISRRHLRRVLDGYWEHEWRHAHKGYDESPEDHLWRAAVAVADMEDALEELVENR